MWVLQKMQKLPILTVENHIDPITAIRYTLEMHPGVVAQSPPSGDPLHITSSWPTPQLASHRMHRMHRSMVAMRYVHST